MFQMMKYLFFFVLGAIFVGAFNELGKDVYLFFKSTDLKEFNVIYTESKHSGVAWRFVATLIFIVIFILMYSYYIITISKITGFKETLKLNLNIFEISTYISTIFSFQIAFIVALLFNLKINYNQLPVMYFFAAGLFFMRLFMIVFNHCEDLLFNRIVLFDQSLRDKLPRLMPWSRY